MVVDLIVLRSCKWHDDATHGVRVVTWLQSRRVTSCEQKNWIQQVDLRLLICRKLGLFLHEYDYHFDVCDNQPRRIARVSCIYPSHNVRGSIASNEDVIGGVSMIRTTTMMIALEDFQQTWKHFS